jgi:hypothetical protein
LDLIIEIAQLMLHQADSANINVAIKCRLSRWKNRKLRLILVNLWRLALLADKAPQLIFITTEKGAMENQRPSQSYCELY